MFMRLTNISVIGWIHTLACISALVLGGWNIVTVKQTHSHKLRGMGYLVSMILAMGLSLLVYRFDLPLNRGARPGPGVFGIFHWFSVLALAFTLLGYYAASRQVRGFWAYTHPICMTLSYCTLIAGLINELFTRLNILRPYAYHIVNGRSAFGSRTVSMTHFTNVLAAGLLVVLFMVKVWRYRRLYNFADRAAEVATNK
jgi:hypothetical protein